MEPVILETPWTLYAKKEHKGSNKQNVYNLLFHNIYEFQTIQDFWKCYNNIPDIDRLPIDASLHFMRKGTEPTWEDNKNGTICVIRVEKNKTKVIATEMILYMIAEQLENVTGISIIPKHKDNTIQIWMNKNSDNDAFAEKIKEIIHEDVRYFFREINSY